MGTTSWDHLHMNCQEPGWAGRLSDLSYLWSPTTPEAADRYFCICLTDYLDISTVRFWYKYFPVLNEHLQVSRFPHIENLPVACQLKDVFYWNLNVGYRLPSGWSSGFGESVTNTACNLSVLAALRTPALCSLSHLFRLIDTNFENLFACKLKGMLYH